MIPTKIQESPKVQQYLKSRNLEKQYLKATKNLLRGNFRSIDFKTRKPKSSGIFQFRINKKFRAIGFFKGTILRISKIDDHQ